MNGTTTEGLQPVSDFLPQKPQTDSAEPSDFNPVTKAETALPGFPVEPKVDAPTLGSDAQTIGLATQTDIDVNTENYKQNAEVSVSSSVANEKPSTNGVSPDKEGDQNGITNTIGNDVSSPVDKAPSPPQLPQSETVAPQEPSSTEQQPAAQRAADDQTPISSLPAEQTLDMSTQISPPLEQPPTSDLRTTPKPLSEESEAVQRIKDENHQKDLERDPELAQALSAGSDAPVDRSVEPPQVIEESLLQVDAVMAEADPLKTGDVVDTTTEQLSEPVKTVEATPVDTSVIPQPDALSVPIEQPITPVPTPAVADTPIVLPTPEPTASVDQAMTDAPPPQQKVAREREDDVEAEPASKRAKVESEGSEPEFKVPELPQAVQPAPEGNAADRMTIPRVKHLNRAIQSAKKVQCSRFYKIPVDPVAMNIPTYPEIVKEPMDLSTVEKKLKADPSEYATVSAFMADIDLMVNNASRFNGSDHIVTKEGRELQQRLLKDVSNLPPADFEEPSKAEKKAQKAKVEPSRSVPARRQSNPVPGPARSPPASTANQTFALTPDGVPLIRRDSNVNDGRPKRAIHPPKRRDDITGGRPKKKKFEWQLKFCREVLNELKKPKHYNYAQYFYYPVDPVALNIPSYHSVIKKPMDLQTVETKLNGNEYEKAKDFEDDVRQIFKNCFKFNIKGDVVFSCGEQTLKVFDEKWATKDDWLDDHEPQSGPATPASESEEDEEEDAEENDSEAERNEKLQQLQKQIEMMSKQMGELANAKKKKKPTPPVAGKKAKKSGGKKDKNSSFPGLSSRKDKSKSKKPEKERFVSYNEKQFISAGISGLPDNKMSEALRIIQSNVPSLKDTHETEIELDIDELPNGVLLKLLAFVKKFVPHAPPEPEPEKSYRSSTLAAPSKPKKNKPMNKHEQEAQIEELKGRLGRYGEQISPEPVQSIEQGDSSGDESDDSEESEEE